MGIFTGSGSELLGNERLRLSDLILDVNADVSLVMLKLIWTYNLLWSIALLNGIAADFFFIQRSFSYKNLRKYYLNSSL